MRAEIEGVSRRPIDAKKRLAQMITSIFHGDAAGDAALEYFESTFQRRETPDEMPEHAVTAAMPLVDLAVEAGLAASKGELRRLVQGGGVQVRSAARRVGHEGVRTGSTRWVQVQKKK